MDNSKPKPERFVKIFTGTTIDLDYIVSISSVYVTNYYSPDELVFGFQIKFKLTDKPLTFERNAKPSEEEHVKVIKNNKTINVFGYKMMDGKVLSIHWNNGIPEYYLKENRYNETLAYNNFQKQVDEVILLWKNYVSFKDNEQTKS